ncbi:MAG: hypothetical protein ACI4TM_05905 [Candidatus Cryptobacteroides sp.]
MTESAEANATQVTAQVAVQEEYHDSTALEFHAKTVLQETVDSMVFHKVEAEVIPQDSAQTLIPTRSIADLPDGAKFSSQSGRASVELTKQGDNVLVSARCDSVARKCEYYERVVFRQRNEIDSLQNALNSYDNTVQNWIDRQTENNQTEVLTAVSETEKPPSGRFWKGLLLGLITGIGGFYLVDKTTIISKITSLIKIIV